MIWNQMANEMLIFGPFATSRLERAPLFRSPYDVLNIKYHTQHSKKDIVYAPYAQ
jgi:hypothetical protein